jgi:hypothetical protein
MVLLPLGDPLPQIAFALLHGVQFSIPKHLPVIVAVFFVQPLYPLLLPLTLFPRRCPHAIPRRRFQLPYHRVVARLARGHHCKAIPLVLPFVFNIVERVVQRVIVRLRGIIDDAQNVARLRVALDFNLLDALLLGRLRYNVQTVRCAVRGCVGARGGGVVEAEEFNRLFGAAGCVVETRGEAKAAIVLGECFFLVPEQEKSAHVRR